MRYPTRGLGEGLSLRDSISLFCAYVQGDNRLPLAYNKLSAAGLPPVDDDAARGDERTLKQLSRPGQCWIGGSRLCGSLALDGTDQHGQALSGRGVSHEAGLC